MAMRTGETHGERPLLALKQIETIPFIKVALFDQFTFSSAICWLNFYLKFAVYWFG